VCVWFLSFFLRLWVVATCLHPSDDFFGDSLVFFNAMWLVGSVLFCLEEEQKK
jgi:hypothetical protein